MRLRSFHAPSAREALLLARAEMGDQARIVTTRATARGIELVVVDGLRSPQNEELLALREEVRELRERLAETAPAPPGLEELDRRLAARGIVGDLRARILAAAAPHRGVRAMEAAHAAIAAAVPILPPRPARAGAPRIVAFVGPTGAGKTTTLAKLAGRLVGEARRKVGILSLDTRRPGAPEALGAYAEMLGCPFEAILAPDELPRAVGRVRGRDAILLDTTGRSPLDALHLAHLSQVLGAVAPLEVLLVLPATSSAAALREAARAFAAVRATGLVVTKLDETQRNGAPFSVALEHRLPVAFLCDGPSIPADLERASAARIAGEILKAPSTRPALAAPRP